MAEHARIARYFAPLTAGEPGAFHLTDDAARLTPPPGIQLVITSDSVIEGIHVLERATPAQIAQKLLRRNLSDLAAMGATPWRYSLNLHTPAGCADEWFAQFAAALAQEQKVFGVTLIGGDSTSGAADAPVHATATLIGLAQAELLRRNGAQAGDAVYVSGTLGDAALGLNLLQRNISLPEALYDFAVDRYHCPQPRLALGQALVGIASAALDISDGLLGDAAHLAQQSGVGLKLDGACLPLSDAMQNAVAQDAKNLALALSGGDDYELCFTAPAFNHAAVQHIAERLQLPLTRIGEVVAGSGVTVRNVPDTLCRVAGFSHA